MNRGPTNLPDVQVLLSTFDGARHLDALLDSLAGQSHPGWSLLIRDDGSRDGTQDIIERWRARDPHRIEVLANPQNLNLRAVESFSRLLQRSTAPYVMFADQDDVWNADKIALTLSAMRRRAAEIGSDRPILVHTDLRVVDEQLNVVADSFWDYQGLAPMRTCGFSGLLVENVVWGCTAMLNRALVRLIGDIPHGARHHDWWVAMVAAAFGEIVSLPERTLLWRRHGGNESETSNLRQAFWRSVTDTPAMRRRLQRLLEESRPDVGLFLQRYGGSIRPEAREAATAFLTLPSKGGLAKRLSILRHRLFFSSPLRNAGLMVLV